MSSLRFYLSFIQGRPSMIKTSYGPNTQAWRNSVVLILKRLRQKASKVLQKRFYLAGPKKENNRYPSFQSLKKTLVHTYLFSLIKKESKLFKPFWIILDKRLKKLSQTNEITFVFSSPTNHFQHFLNGAFLLYFFTKSKIVYTLKKNEGGIV